MTQISENDRKLLAILQEDASFSINDLAKATNTSSATCWRRIKNLEERSVMGPPVRIVDPAKVGRNIDAFCQVKMKSQDALSREALQRTVENEAAIIEVYSISGEWDYLLHLLVHDIADLENVLLRRIVELDCVAGTTTLFAMRRIKHTTSVPL